MPKVDEFRNVKSERLLKTKRASGEHTFKSGSFTDVILLLHNRTGGVYQHSNKILMGVKCVPLLADMFLYHMELSSHRSFSV